MYDTLLFLHVLGAFVTFVTVVIFSAYAFGLTASRSSFVLADLAWNVSGALLIVFGIWLALLSTATSSGTAGSSGRWSCSRSRPRRGGVPASRWWPGSTAPPTIHRPAR